jgi:glycosyltransferase involved in cell wall biosynthesis
MQASVPTAEDVARPWVAYVGPFHYPEGGAAARRVLGMAECLSIAGYDVVVASGAGDSLGEEDLLQPQGEGIAYCLLAERVAEHWPRPLRRFRYAWMGKRTVEWLGSRPMPPAAVVLYSGYTPYLQRLLPWCRRNNIPLLFDAVEWYEPSRPLGYLTSPYQWNIEWAMRHLIPKVDGVIAISRYLAGYYQARGLPLAIVPPTTSRIHAGDWQPDSRLRLCYAGNPGVGKDDLPAVLRAIAGLTASGAPVHLTVAGPDQASVMAMMGESATRQFPWLHTAGSLSHEQVRKLVGRMDFSILVRPQCRTSKAGFPTKFVESFASGTPVIANLTSDLGQYLRDGETGLVCDSNTVVSISETLQRALSLDVEVRRAMRSACLQQARKAFHPEAYAGVLGDLLRSVAVDA